VRVRVLVAEDETIIRLDLRALLERAGFESVSFRLLAGGIVALHTGTAR
jgi:CheY-like chemotaxis protein